MIKYKQDIIQLLKDKGYSTYRIRKEKLLSEKQLQYFRKGIMVRTETLDKLCELLECQPGELLEWVRNDSASDNE